MGEAVTRTLSLIVALALVRAADGLVSVANHLAARVLGERLCHVGDGVIAVWHDCPRCEGKGFHHGFGEDGIDPDWCTHCGGPGEETFDLTIDDAIEIGRAA